MTNMIYTAMPALPKKHHTNAVVLPSEWNAYPLSSIAEEISETVGTRKMFYTKEIFHTIKEILTYILRAVFTA